MHHVIHIFGASGAGTSTLGRAICDAFGFTLIDTDDYFWIPTDPPFTQKRPRQERISLILQKMRDAESVVISGSLTDWGDSLIPYFTLAIRLVTDTATRIERLEKRERALFGSRLDPGGDMYEQHREFIAWASAYDSGSIQMRSKASHDLWQTNLSCPLLIQNGADPITDQLRKIKEVLSSLPHS